MIDCLTCHYRTRADQLIEDATGLTDVEGKPTEELDQIMPTKVSSVPNAAIKPGPR